MKKKKITELSNFIAYTSSRGTAAFRVCDFKQQQNADNSAVFMQVQRHLDVSVLKRDI